MMMNRRSSPSYSEILLLLWTGSTRVLTESDSPVLLNAPGTATPVSAGRSSATCTATGIGASTRT